MSLDWTGFGRWALIVRRRERHGERPGRPDGPVASAILVEAHRQMSPNPEAPVVAGPPFPPHGGPQAQAPVRCARTRVRGGRHPGERRRDGEVVILLRVHGVFGPETV